MLSLFELWPATVTVTVAVPGLSGNGPVDGGSWNTIEVSLQLMIVSFAPQAASAACSISAP